MQVAAAPVYNERWQLLARYEGADVREQWLPHAAGLDGLGGSSYIDSVILRTTYTGTGGSVVEDDRFYYAQNWRADVSVVLDDSGVQQERVSYSPYGQPFGIAAGDTDFDGDFESGVDGAALNGWSGAGKPYRGYADVNLDGSINSTDGSAADADSLGWDVLTSNDVLNRIGYAGYVHDRDVATAAHVRYRVYKIDLGRWVQRDPLGYTSNVSSLYDALLQKPLIYTDPSGLCADGCGMFEIDACYDVAFPPEDCPGRGVYRPVLQGSCYSWYEPFPKCAQKRETKFAMRGKAPGGEPEIMGVFDYLAWADNTTLTFGGAYRFYRIRTRSQWLRQGMTAEYWNFTQFASGALQGPDATIDCPFGPSVQIKASESVTYRRTEPLEDDSGLFDPFGYFAVLHIGFFAQNSCDPPYASQCKTVTYFTTLKLVYRHAWLETFEGLGLLPAYAEDVLWKDTRFWTPFEWCCIECLEAWR